MKKAAAKLQVVPEPPKLLKLDLGSGQNCRDGFDGVDFVAGPGIKYVTNLLKFPWPFETDSVVEANCSHFFEHVPGLLRGKWMDELYRILAPDGTVTIVCPFYTSVRATQDFTHEWPPVSANSFLYFNKKWREDNKLTHGHYDLKCDFDFVYGYAISASWAARNDEARNFAFQHYGNSIDDIQLTLTSRKGKTQKGNT